ncbi:MAG: TIGR01777 family oxidoreductase [Trueperaceae bacterium]|nr:MAG: TIGR01777 family oxidoreductase [Trueperaceae bacterium]
MILAGGSGFIGRHLIAAALPHYHVILLTRRIDGGEPTGVRPLTWQPRAAREKDEAALEQLAQALDGAHAVINLAGASIAKGRLGEAHQRRVTESRVDSTTTLLEAYRRAERPPKAWFQASAVGYYGDSGDSDLSEESAPGTDALARSCLAWEGAAAPLAEHTRLIIGRIGLVLAKNAPAWRMYLAPIRLGLGGRLGSGRQWYAWIDAGDLTRAILYLLENETCQGVYNLTTPGPVRQLELSRKAATRLHRPALLPAPAFALRLALGGLADAALLGSIKALPLRLEADGFAFEHADIDSELDKLLG